MHFKLSLHCCIVVDIAISSTIELMKQTWFLLTKKEPIRSLFSQLDDFDQDFVIGIIASDRHENTTVNEGTGHQDLTAGTSDDKLMTNEDTVNVTTLERCFNERIDREILTLSKTESEKQFWPLMMVLLLLKSN